MIYKVVDLYEYFKKEKPAGANGTLTVYVHSQVKNMQRDLLRPAILVIPGGGYAFVSEREAEPVANEFYHEGYNAFVLDYSVAPDCHYPTQHIEAAMAMLYIRDNAEEFCVIKDKVAAVGFSAGGHLTGVVSLLNDNKEIVDAFGERAKEIKPDVSVYSYAVVTSDKKYFHGDSFKNLCGEKYNFDDFSLDKKVTKDASPAFIWTTFEDTAVPVKNSLMLAEAYLNAGVPCELHVYESGPHGMSTCGKDVYFDDINKSVLKRVSTWIFHAFAFLKDKGFEPKWK